MQPEYQWEPLAPLRACDPPPFPQVFEHSLRDWVTGLSAAVQIPPEVPALLTLSAISAACQGKYAVKVTPSWTEPLTLWTLTALPPGSRKSALLNKVLEPIGSWEHVKAAEMSEDIRAAESERKTRLMQIEHMRKKASTLSGQDFQYAMEEIAELERQLPRSLQAPRILVSDVTAEKLAVIMSQNDGCAAIFSDEPAPLEIALGRYSGGNPILEIFNQGWGAGSQVRVDRNSRDSIEILSPALTIGLTIQPDVIRRLHERPQVREQGFIHRFLMAFPDDPIGKRSLSVPEIPAHATAAYHHLVTSLLNIPVPSEHGKPAPHLLTLTPEARQVFEDFYQGIEARICKGGDMHNLASWGSKLQGNTARIAGLLHLAKHGRGEIPFSIQAAEVECAVRLARCLIDHAHLGFDLIGLDDRTLHAERILDWVKYERLTHFTHRECYQRFKSTFRNVKNMKPAMDLLHEINAIRTMQIRPEKGRPSVVHPVNPELHEA